MAGKGQLVAPRTERGGGVIIPNKTYLFNIMQTILTRLHRLEQYVEPQAKENFKKENVVSAAPAALEENKEQERLFSLVGSIVEKEKAKATLKQLSKRVAEKAKPAKPSSSKGETGMQKPCSEGEMEKEKRPLKRPAPNKQEWEEECAEQEFQKKARQNQDWRWRSWEDGAGWNWSSWKDGGSGSWEWKSWKDGGGWRSCQYEFVKEEEEEM